MKLFTGTYTHALDAKNRVSVPRKMLDVLRQREGGGNEVVITIGFDGCLELYSPDEFERLSGDINAASQGDARVRRLGRIWFSQAETCPVDKNGRMLLPEALKQRGRIGDKVVFAAAGTRVELWSPEEWAVRDSEGLAEYEHTAKDVLG